MDLLRYLAFDIQRTLRNGKIGASKHASLNRQVGHARSSGPGAHLCVADNLDAPNEDGRPLDESSGLMHGGAGFGIDPNLALHQSDPLLSWRDLENVICPARTLHRAEVPKLVVR